MERTIVQHDELVKHACGATASKVPRFGMIPRVGHVRLARRFELGEIVHTDADQWRKGIGDRDYAIARAEHVIDHASKLIAKLKGHAPIDGDDDCAAIAWGGTVLCEITDPLLKDSQ